MLSNEIDDTFKFNVIFLFKRECTNHIVTYTHVWLNAGSNWISNWKTSCQFISSKSSLLDYKCNELIQYQTCLSSLCTVEASTIKTNGFQSPAWRMLWLKAINLLTIVISKRLCITGNKSRRRFIYVRTSFATTTSKIQSNYLLRVLNISSPLSASEGPITNLDPFPLNDSEFMWNPKSPPRRLLLLRCIAGTASNWSSVVPVAGASNKLVAASGRYPPDCFVLLYC